MEQYKSMIQRVLKDGDNRGDRTGTGTHSVFGHQERYDLSQGFPLLPLKKTYWKGIVHELLWFLRGDTNIKYLVDNGVTIWNPDAERWERERGGAFGELGPIYGKQWRSWDAPNGETIDQIQKVIESIKTNPYSRRHIVSAWNVAQLDDMALPPCHTLFQFYVSNGKLSCQLYQRSADLFLGVPFNIASYALLTHMIAHLTGLKVGEFIHTIGDLHLYNNHLDKAVKVLERENLALPELKILRDVKDINDFKFEDFELVGYKPHSAIKAKVSVG